MTASEDCSPFVASETSVGPPSPATPSNDVLAFFTSVERNAGETRRAVPCHLNAWLDYQEWLTEGNRSW